MGQDPEKQRKHIDQQWSSYKALFESYKDYSFYQQIFLFVFIIRLTFFNGVIGYLHQYPLAQAILITGTNFFMLLYLLIKRPMRKLINLIQQIILELVLLPFNICVLILAIMDKQELVELERRKSIGNAMVYLNVVVPILSLALMAMKFIAIGIDVYKQWKAQKKLNQGRFKNAQPTINITQERLPFNTSLNTSGIDNTQMFDISPDHNNQNLLTQCNSFQSVTPQNVLNTRMSRPNMMMQRPILANARMRPPQVPHKKRIPNEDMIFPQVKKVRQLRPIPMNAQMNQVGDNRVQVNQINLGNQARQFSQVNEIDSGQVRNEVQSWEQRRKIKKLNKAGQRRNLEEMRKRFFAERENNM